MKFKLGQKIIDKLRNKKQNENKKLLENVLNCLQSILQINNKILERSNYVGGQRWEIELQERYKNKLYLDGFGYKVFSQNDEDGIINEIFTRIGTTNKKFIEFGVQDGIECNSHLLLDTGWSGLWIDGNKDDCNKIKTFFKTSLEDKKLAILNDFITKDNINELFAKAEFQGEIDFLSIDIDGNDWHVLEAILKRKQIIPRVICVEYKTIKQKDLWQQYCSETYIASHFLKNIGVTPEYTLKHTWKIYKDLFIFIDKEILDMYWPKYTNLDSRWRLFRPNMLEEMRHSDWLNLYLNDDFFIKEDIELLIPNIGEN